MRVVLKGKELYHFQQLRNSERNPLTFSKHSFFTPVFFAAWVTAPRVFTSRGRLFLKFEKGKNKKETIVAFERLIPFDFFSLIVHYLARI
jgi:hypothetical protein